MRFVGKNCPPPKKKSGAASAQSRQKGQLSGGVGLRQISGGAQYLLGCSINIDSCRTLDRNVQGKIEAEMKAVREGVARVSIELFQATPKPKIIIAK